MLRKLRLRQKNGFLIKKKRVLPYLILVVKKWSFILFYKQPVYRQREAATGGVL